MSNEYFWITCRYVKVIPQNTQDGSFYRAILAIHKEQYKIAQDFIDRARDMIDTELTAMAGESYQRAYGAMVQVQMLSELEEARYTFRGFSHK